MDIQVQVNRWFQKSYGNTYHKVYVTGGVFLESEIEYGYGDAWLITLHDLLVNAGIAKKKKDGMSYRLWLKGYNIILQGESINDVNRKRDL